MAFELGTYGSAVFSPTLGWAIPEPGDSLTWDWMNTVGLFSQRARRMATVVTTINNLATYTFDYSALRNDYFPPYLKAYYNESGVWNAWYGFGEGWCIFSEIGLTSAKFINNTGAQRSFQLLAYL
jgi:hypothetical protein